MTRAPWRAAALVTAGLAAATPAALPLQGDSKIGDAAAPAETAEQASPIEAFFAALDGLRSGDAAARAALARAARELGREDARAIAQYYLDLSPAAHGPSLAAEARLDQLRERAAELDELDASANEASRRALRLDLEELSRTTATLEDVVPHAHLASLLSRLQIRSLEEDLGATVPDGAALDAVRALAEGALARFARAGMSTPRLEPLWTLARAALLEGDLAAAERAFLELERRAAAASRPLWEERALLGLVGVHRARGAPHAAGRALARLARDRDPRSCWSLAREVAVQRLSRDDAEGARRWLREYPPSLDDPEIELEAAESEWEALLVAADLRAGRADAAAARRPETPALLRAALLLELDDPGAALEALERATTSERSGVDHAALTGRALVAAGRHEEAIEPLTAALVRAARRPVTTGAVRDASAVGEWLGLSSVIDLALCHIEARGDALGAAAVIEASHGGGDVEMARALVLEAASRTDHGLITWLTGADRTLRVVVAPDGSAEARLLPHGRAAVARAVERARSAVRDAANEAALAKDLTPLARALLPEGARGGDGGSLLLLPHGPLERAPFEAMPTAAGAPLGLRRALRVATTLRADEDRAARTDLRRARWSGFGAPVRTSAAALDAAREELESLDALSPRFDARVGDAFTDEALAAALSGAAPVHVATHVTRAKSALGLVPLGLLTSDDRVLDGERIAAIAPRLPLLAFVACGSADGTSLDGVGVRGLAQLAIDAGTREALVTQWPVEDRSASRASLAFHGALRSGEDPAEATRRARVMLAGIGAAPREWAAYRLLGAP